MKKIITCIIGAIILSCTSILAQSLLYRVEPGDTFESISKEFGVSIGALKEANPNAKTLFVGMKINIPEKQTATTVTDTPTDTIVNIITATSNEPVDQETATQTPDPAHNSYKPSISHESSTKTYTKAGGGMIFDESEMVKNAYFLEYSFGARSYAVNPLFVEYGLGYIIDSSWGNEKNYKFETTSHTLQAPLLLGVSIGESIGTNIYFGPYLDFTLASKAETEIFGEKSVTRIRDIDDYNRFMLGLKFGGEINIYGCMLGACYSFGLTSHYKGIDASGSRLLIYLAF